MMLENRMLECCRLADYAHSSRDPFVGRSTIGQMPAAQLHSQEA